MLAILLFFDDVESMPIMRQRFGIIIILLIKNTTIIHTLGRSSLLMRIAIDLATYLLNALCDLALTI